MLDWLTAQFELLQQLWILWFMALFIGIVVWAFWPGNKRRLEKHGRIPLDDDK